MSKGFLFKPEVHSYEKIAKFLESKGYKIEWDFKMNPIYPEYIKSGDNIVFVIEGKYIYIDKPLLGNGRPEAAVMKFYSASKEWKEYMYLNGQYLGKKNAELKEDYEKAKKEYQEMCKKNDKVYALLKRKFELKERLKVDDSKEEKKGFFGKLFGG